MAMLGALEGEASGIPTFIATSAVASDIYWRVPDSIRSKYFLIIQVVPKQTRVRPLPQIGQPGGITKYEYLLPVIAKVIFNSGVLTSPSVGPRLHIAA